MNLNEVGYFIRVEDVQGTMFDSFYLYRHGAFDMSSPHLNEVEDEYSTAQFTEYDAGGTFVVGFTPEGTSVYIQFDILDNNTEGMAEYTGL